MSDTVLHQKYSTIADDSNTALVRPSDWNHEHIFNNGSLLHYLMWDNAQSDKVVFDNLFARLPTIDVTKPPYNINPSSTIDNTSAILTLFSNLPTHGIVYFPAGTYNISSTILPSRPVIVIGDGPDNTSFVATSPAINVFSTEAMTTIGQCIFKDFAIGASVIKTTGAGILLTTSTPLATPQRGHVIDNLRINSQYNGIHVANSIYCVIKNNTINESLTNSIILNCSNSPLTGQNIVERNLLSSTPGANGILNINAKNRIINNTILGHAQGILVQPDQAPLALAGCYIAGNSLENQSSYSILVQTPVVGSALSQVLIVSNTIFGNTATGGIAINGSISIGHVTGNMIQLGLTSNTGISVFPPATSIAISHNFIRSLVATAIGIHGGGIAAISVIHNFLTGMTTPYFGLSGTFIDSQVRTVAQLSTTALDGSTAYTSDGLKGSDPLTGGSTGAFAIRANGVWRGV